ncbi:Wall-associated receptor kinase-like 1 [Citrus sinensis]|uniref:Wall-associated receptor kinase-like 1 n=1 Tax=Citrus sinensis TaxID=2711 RepID=A0ACB8K956_CITSI|nr:Wall-associated receptor kinase-like 1 [Citrus sinensis]
MNLQLLLQVIILLLLWPIKSVAKEPPPPLTKPNCPYSCGNNVTIPFPFGIGENCYFDQLYAIDCKSSKPILRSINLEVLEFLLEKSTMRVNQSVIRSCQDKTTEASFVNLEKLPFYFSYYDNIFSGIGCNNLASMSSADRDFILGGCFSICDPRNKTDDDSCNGIACCKAGVPWALKSFNISISSINNAASSSSSSSQEEGKCKFAFMVEKEWFESKFKSAEGVQDWNQVPVILDWRIPNSSFGKLERDESPKFTSTSHCESDEGGLFRCSCKEKYHGNPYFLHGCQGIGTGLGGLLLSIGALWLCIIIRRRIKQKEENFKKNGGLLLEQQLNSLDGSIDRCKIFNSKELDKATDHFNVNRILGQGGQGTVYKGMLADGRIIAVKKSKVVDESKLEEFINEVVILSQISHRNVVKLLGSCLEVEVPLLVYEFIPNGTLFQYLHDPSEELSLTWEMRLRIATEVAEALAYLHSSAYLPIYHRDIKSTNILLDEKYRAKIADFGTSRSIAIDQTHVSTKVQGTFGYLDPEYFHSSQFTDKSDVYSFGVVLVELLTGQKPISYIWANEGRNLATYFVECIEENCLFDILDDQVRKSGKTEEIMEVSDVAKRCLNSNGRSRPTMKEVAMELERIRACNLQDDDDNIQKCYEELSM